ncbi:hypothetical protein [Lentzea sp. CA-135723]
MRGRCRRSAGARADLPGVLALAIAQVAALVLVFGALPAVEEELGA